MSAEKPPAYVLTPEDIEDLHDALIKVGRAWGGLMGVLGRIEEASERRWQENGHAAAEVVIPAADLTEIERYANGA